MDSLFGLYLANPCFYPDASSAPLKVEIWKSLVAAQRAIYVEKMEHRKIGLEFTAYEELTKYFLSELDGTWMEHAYAE